MLPGLGFEDLVQAGWEGLHHGAQRFDHSLGYAESTYLLWWVRRGVVRAYQDHSRTVRVPVHLQERACRGEVPAEAARSVACSLDAPIGEEGRAWHEQFEDEDATDPERAALDTDLSDELAAAIDALPERHAEIIRGRMRERTLNEIGVELGVSRERVRQLEVEATELLTATVRGERARARGLWRSLHANAARVRSRAA